MGGGGGGGEDRCVCVWGGEYEHGWGGVREMGGTGRWERYTDMGGRGCGCGDGWGMGSREIGGGGNVGRWGRQGYREMDRV